MRFYFTEQVAYNFYVCFTDWVFLNLTCFIEWQIEEVATFQRYIIISTSCTGFTTTNQTFDSQNITAVHITVFLLLQEIAYFYIFFIDNQIFAIIEELIESIDKMHETNYFFVTYGDITGSFVSYVYFVLLFYQTAKRTTH